MRGRNYRLAAVALAAIFVTGEGGVLLGRGSAGGNVPGERTASTRQGVPSTGAATRAGNMDAMEFLAIEGRSSLPYKRVREMVDPASLPRLRAALKDPAQAASWPKIARLMGCVGDDAETARDLLEYMRRAEKWDGLKDNDLFSRMTGKISTLQWVGKIGGKESVAELKKALTEAGAKDLAKEWINGPLPEWSKTEEGVTVQLIRGTAAIGLVQSQDAEGIRLVEQEYERVHEGRKNGEAVSEYYNQLVDAMASRDMIRDMGKEEFLNLSGSEIKGQAIRPYLMKYNWTSQQPATTGK
jgi:hypothetical protein